LHEYNDKIRREVSQEKILQNLDRIKTVNTANINKKAIKLPWRVPIHCDSYGNVDDPPDSHHKAQAD